MKENKELTYLLKMTMKVGKAAEKNNKLYKNKYGSFPSTKNQEEYDRAYKEYAQALHDFNEKYIIKSRFMVALKRFFS